MIDRMAVDEAKVDKVWVAEVYVEEAISHTPQKSHSYTVKVKLLAKCLGTVT
jgi:hypothetical protein